MVYNRFFQFMILLSWAGSMSWLLATKILPALIVGDPPTYEQIVEAQRRDNLVAWQLRFDDEHIGTAITHTHPASNDMTQVDHVIHFDDFPGDKMFPTVWKLVLGPSGTHRRFRLDLRSTIYFDGLKRLSSFETKLYLPPQEESLFSIRGSIEQDVLSLYFTSPGFRYDTELPLSQRSILTDQFAPQSQLPGLKKGQAWTIEVYSPFSIAQHVEGTRPLEILHAEVVGQDFISWEGRPTRAWVVEYTDDPGRRVNGDHHVRGRVWVAPEGTILRQEARLGAGKLLLVRMDRARTLQLARREGMLE
ncbi:hypothetical protein JCM19992_20070 [Thermostilla marina]